MILKTDQLAKLLDDAKELLRIDPQLFLLEDEKRPDPFVIAPRPYFASREGKPEIPLDQLGSSSLDLRLGTWFVTLRAAQMELLCVDPNEEPSDDERERQRLGEPHSESPTSVRRNAQLAETHYIPFGGRYILHPRSFVLGTTLEWIRLPRRYAGSVIGKSSWGRRGLIIATATGVHPGFTGCLTLELTNVGEIPIEISPGMRICQLSLFEAKGDNRVDQSGFAGKRRPVLGKVTRDAMAEALANP